MAVDIRALLDANQLDEAITALNGEVRARPTDTGLRATLIELLCFAGNLERADALLDAITQLDTNTAVGAALYRQLLRAEQARLQFYSDGRVPEFLTKPDAVSELELRAAVHFREGDTAGSAALIEERDALRPVIAGVADQVAFDDFRDLDDFNAGHLEVLTPNGKYYWVSLTSITEIEFHAPERQRDLLWRRAHLSMTEAPDGEVFLPSIYVASDSTNAHRLGHVTDFSEVEGAPVLGRGLRSFLVGEESKTIMELGKIAFSGAAA